jgi:hypothetical protein
MSVEAHEAARVSGLPEAPLKAPVPLDRKEVSLQDEARKAVSVVLRAEMSTVRQALNELVHDIRANTEIARMIDVPLEQVAGAHERASQSFENLRHDIAGISARLGAVEGVIDTAGLKQAQEGAEARFARAADLLEACVEELVRLQGGSIEALRAKMAEKGKRKGWFR